MPVPLLLEILRHGHADPADTGGDAGRPLSAAGRRAVADLAAKLANDGWRADRIFSSPLLRARQTAEIVRGASPHAPAIEPLDELRPEWEPSDLLVALEARKAVEGRVLLVSHQPLAGRLAALLTGAVQPFKPGTLVGIECETGLGAMRGRVTRVIDPGD